MGRIKNEDLYILDQTVSGNDRLIGSDGDDLKKTKNFSVDDLLGYFQNNNPTDYVLPTATETILGGVKIDGDTITITDGVISASADVIASGLEEITENGNTGWRFIGESVGDNVNRYFIGQNAIDAMQFRGATLGQPDVPSLPFGTKSTDGINFGVDNKDNATFNTIVIGAVNQTNAYAFATMIGGYNNIGYGYGDVCIGSYNTTNPSNVNSFLFAMGHNVRMNGERGGVGLGLAITHNSRGAVIVGTSNVPWAGAVNASNRPAFTVGIGTTTTPAGRWQPLVQKDGFNVLFSGEAIANSVTNALIDAEPTGKVLVTKEWITAQGFSTGGGGVIGGSISDNQVAVGAATADTIEGNSGFTFDALVASPSTGGKLTIGQLAGAGFGWLHLGHGFGGQSYLTFDTAGTGAIDLWGLLPSLNGTGHFEIRGDGFLAFEINQDTFAISAPGVTIAEIDADDGKVLVTKEWITAQGFSGQDRVLENLTVTTSLALDWGAYETFRLTLTGATTLSETNLPTSGSKTITLHVTGDFAITYPSGWSTYISGTYDGTVLNVIVVEFVNATTDFYKVQISQPN